MSFKLVSRDYLNSQSPKLNIITIKIKSRDCHISFSDEFLYLSSNKLEELRNEIESLIKLLLKPDYIKVEDRTAKVIAHKRRSTDEIKEKLKKKNQEYLRYKTNEKVSTKLWDTFLQEQKDNPIRLTVKTSELDYIRILYHNKDKYYTADISEVKEQRDIINKHIFYVYKNDLYCFDDKNNHYPEEQKLLIKEKYYKQQQKFQRLQKEIKLFEKLETADLFNSRDPIPDEVRFIVWRRDGGKCVKCGSKKELEFDHIIPVSKGGSKTERNLQLLCQKCNRGKSNKI